jgi:hypothetical protein
MQVYCPYTDQFIDESQTAEEHIIPLSLGGNSQFTLPVEKQRNSELGSKIDGRLADDFFILRQRIRFDARGHSGKEPENVFKQVTDVGSGRPMQFVWGKAMRLWDVLSRKPMDPSGRELQISLKLDLDIPIRFVAKVFLSAGYFVYGDFFRTGVDHHEPRLLMNSGLSGLSNDEKSTLKTRFFTRFQGAQPEQLESHTLDTFICQSVRGSCVVFTAAQGKLIMFVGILGTYLGMLNVPADTSRLPTAENFDLGHAVIVSKGDMRRGSYRELMGSLLKKLEDLPGRHG